MADKPLEVPIWNTGATNNVEPSAAKKVLGWEVVDDPPSSFWNWLQGLTGNWLTWLNDRTSNAGTAPRIGLIGVNSTATDANGTGGTFTGNGTGSAVQGITPATAAIAVEADASAGTGYGLVAKADVTSPARSAGRLVPQDSDPTIPLLGDIYSNSVTGRLKYYDGVSWRNLDIGSLRSNNTAIISTDFSTVETTVAGGKVAGSNSPDVGFKVIGNTLHVGSRFLFEIVGTVTGGTDDIEPQLHVGNNGDKTDALIDILGFFVAAAGAAVPFKMIVEIMVSAIGASAHLKQTSCVLIQHGRDPQVVVQNSSGDFDSTVDNYFTMTLLSNNAPTHFPNIYIGTAQVL